MRVSAHRFSAGIIAVALAAAPDAAQAQGVPFNPLGPPISSYPGDPWAVAGPSEADLLSLELVPAGATPPLGIPYVDEVTASEIYSGARAAKASGVWSEAVISFRKGDYLDATRLSENLLKDYPEWRRAKLVRTQALFATGKYRAAAFALREAIETLPEDEWGSVVSRYREFYGHSAALVDQLNALRKYIDKHPKEPEGHLLLAYHFGFLGHQQDAVDALATLYQIQPNDDAGPMLAAKFVKDGGLKTADAPPTKEPNATKALKAAPHAINPPGGDAPVAPAPAPPVATPPAPAPVPPAAAPARTAPSAPPSRSSGPREL